MISENDCFVLNENGFIVLPFPDNDRMKNSDPHFFFIFVKYITLRTVLK